jgi:4-hydroxy-3-polyprenylbenzoate decarboxylase
MTGDRRHLAIAITGASGAIYAARTVAALLARDFHLDLVVSDYGRRLLLEELGPEARADRFQAYLVERYGDSAARGDLVLHSNRDLGSSLASGGTRAEALVVVPCSMKTLAGVAHGLSENLIERAADVMLKERRRLVLVPRETPMSLIALRNMVLCAEAGATILPAMPAFYQQPQSLEDLGGFIAGKILNALGLDQDLFPAWTGE